jgi:hypothetical protein
MNILEFILRILFIVIMLFSIFHWVRSGFWVPKYIHFMALIALLIAGFLAYFAHSINKSNSSITLYLVVGFPLAVYVIYGLYGGGLNSKDIRVNDGLVIDRAMLKNEVIGLFEEHFVPYTKWTFENLLLLSTRKYQSEIQGKSGRSYLFEVSAQKYDKGEDRVVAVYGKLTELRRKMYRPKSRIAFILGRNGTVYRNGLSPHT